MSQLGSYFMREINKKSARFKNKHADFLARINRKLNEQSLLDAGELNRLKEIYDRATSPRRLKW